MKNSITQKIAVVAAFVTLATSSAFADCTKESIAKAIKTDFKNRSFVEFTVNFQAIAKFSLPQ
jgi:hypothetical protein